MFLKRRLAAIAAATVMTCGAAVSALAANDLRWGLAGDAISLDPQGRLVATDFIFLRAAYEGLVVLGKDLKPVPGLAESWENPDPNTWVFKLRSGVTFHEGQEFNADDVVFTFNRMMGENSAFKVFGRGIESVKALDLMTVEIKTAKPNPLFLGNMASVFIMDSGWANEHGVEKAPDAKNPEKYYSDANMNGTGPFKLASRQPDVSTKFVKNASWWGASEYPGNLDSIEAKPISNAATRVAALLSGDLDLLTDVPLPDIERIKSDDRFKVEGTEQFRVIFLGYNYAVDKLETADIEGNPFRNKAVREAINMAINADLIKDRIMRGQSTPTASLIPPGMPGYTDELTKRGAVDIEGAKAKLAEAGYPEGFSVRLDCPNNRYLNDDAICQAVVSMLSKIGIKISLNSLPRDQWSALLTGKKSDFYMLGFGTPTNDAAFIIANVLMGGPFHSGYANDDVASGLAAAGAELDPAKRSDILTGVAQAAKDDAAVAPLHFQVITWGMGANVSILVDPNNIPDFRFATMN